MIIEKKPFSFLLPAVLTVALIFHMLPQTQAVLREIPEKLALVAEAEAKEPVKRKAAGGADDGGNSAVPAAEGAFEDGVYTGSSNGYGGEITVQVTVENGQIIDIGILSAPGETDPYFSLAKSLLDTVKRAQTWDVDTVSGATYSSRGILGAVRNALTGETVDNEEPPSVEPVGTTSQDSFKDPAAYRDGTYYGTASGFGGSIKVEVIIKDGKIADIRVIDASGETGDYLSRAKGVIPRILSKGSPNVDSVSGATYSSGTIRSIAAQIISTIPVVGDEEAGNKEEETQTENTAEGQAVVQAGLPELKPLPAQEEEPADGQEEEPADGEKVPDSGKSLEKEEPSDSDEQEGGGGQEEIGEPSGGGGQEGGDGSAGGSGPEDNGGAVGSDEAGSNPGNAGGNGV